MQPRYTLLSAICFVIAFSLMTDKTIGQIPNPGFENWSGGNPVNWLTSNDPPTFVNVTQATPAHSGSFAVQGSVVAVSTFPFPPFLISGPDGEGYSETSRPAALHGWYKFSPVAGGDIFIVLIGFQKNGNVMGAGSFSTTVSQGSYAEFVANVFYSTADIPDTAIIFAQISNTAGLANVGSTFILDDLVYGASSADVREDASGIPASFSLHQNYPNPFNPTTTIRYELPSASHVTLKVYDVLGEEVATLVDGERAAGVYTADFNASGLSSGAYFYRFTAGGFSSVKKLLLAK